MLAAFLTTVLFSISAVSAQRTTRLLGGTEANFWRILLATAVLGLWAHAFGQGVSGASFRFFLLSGFVGFGLGDMALYHALPRIGARLSILLVQCLAAPFGVIAEWLWLGTTLSWLQMLCGLTVLAGVAVALAPGAHLNITRRILATGVVFGVIAAFGQGFGAVLSRKAYDVASAAGDHVDGMTAAYQRILAGLAVAAIFMAIAWRRGHRRPAAAVVGDADAPPRSVWKEAWPWVVSNGLAGPALGVSCYQWALATTPTGIVLPIVAITPLVVIPMARWTEGERPSARSLWGGALAVAGAIGLTLARDG